MRDDASAVALPLHHRVRHGLRHPANWFQLMRYGAVGVSGYAVNLAVYTAALHLGIDYKVAGVLAFLVAVANNFWWNRHWTFEDARDGHAGFQATRFFTVSAIAFLFSYAVLVLLVEDAALPKVLAQAIAIVCATPLSFLGQKLWSFRR